MFTFNLLFTKESGSPAVSSWPEMARMARMARKDAMEIGNITKITCRAISIDMGCR